MANNLSDLLDRITVQEVDAYVCDANNGRLRGLLGWYVVYDNGGAIGYFPTEPDALRYRLSVVNRRLNP